MPYYIELTFTVHLFHSSKTSKIEKWSDTSNEAEDTITGYWDSVSLTK